MLAPHSPPRQMGEEETATPIGADPSFLFFSIQLIRLGRSSEPSCRSLFPLFPFPSCAHSKKEDRRRSPYFSFSSLRRFFSGIGVFPSSLSFFPYSPVEWEKDEGAEIVDGHPLFLPLSPASTSPTRPAFTPFPPTTAKRPSPTLPPVLLFLSPPQEPFSSTRFLFFFPFPIGGQSDRARDFPLFPPPIGR